MKKPQLIIAASALLLAGGAAFAAPAQAQGTPSIATLQAGAQRDNFVPPSGSTWTSYAPVRIGAQASPRSLPGGGGGTGCPSDAAKSGVYACLSVTHDNGGTGHGVFLRQGKSGSDSTGFGYVHALVDHNLDEPPINYTIGDSAAGIKQPNGRYLYGRTLHYEDEPLESIEVYEQRTAGGGDKHELGVVTAFCRNGGGSEQSKCPDWVNSYFF